jgi:hypothetical protein
METTVIHPKTHRTPVSSKRPNLGGGRARRGTGRRLLATTVVVAVGLSIGLGLADPATASPAAIPDGMSQAIYQQMMAQIPLERAADQIQAAATAGTGHDGFFDTWLNVDRGSVTVYWHGTVPADIARLINTLRSSVTIDVKPAQYSMAELTAAVRQGLTQPGAVSGHPLNDGSGIQLDFGRNAVPALLADSVGVPVRTGLGGPVTLQATCVPTGTTALAAPSRCDDRQPGYWGGNVILNTAQNSFCSSAFGVHDGGGGLYLVTAAHCSENASGTPVNGITFTNGDRTQTVGSSLDVPGPHDWAVIATSSGNQYYDGPGINAGDTHSTKRVVGQGGVSINQSLCESGAVGGVICGMVVEAINVTPAGDPWSGLTEARSTSGQFTIPGDSGGPYFSLAGTGIVTAIGIHQGLATDSSGVRVEVFTPISTMTNDSGLHVNT